jgi:hypothetical protein
MYIVYAFTLQQRVPSISASSSNVPHWDKHSSTYFEVLFAFANVNLHNDGVLVFAHAVDPEVSRSIHNWALTEEFYVAKDWFGISDLDLQSPTNPSKLIIPSRLHPFSFVFYFFHLYFLNSSIHNLCRLASSSSRCLCVMCLF